jgi:mannosyltransferase
VAAWARANGVTIVHCNEHDVYPFGVLVAKLMRVPIVCHVRFRIDGQFSRWAFGGWRRPGAVLWTTAQQREDSAGTDGVVPASRQFLIPLGPDPEQFRFDPAVRAEARRRFDLRDGEVAIGAATALRPIKRIGDFVDLVTELAGRHPHVVGLLAGGAVPEEVAYARGIESRIAATGLGRRLRWLGHLEPMGPFLHSLDVFVSTSEYETFGNSVAEAMACRVPVVGYVGGSVHEIIGQAGLVVPNGDVAGLVSAVEGMVMDPEARSSWATLGEHRVATAFNPEVSFQTLLAVYASLAPEDVPGFPAASGRV